MDTRQVPRHKIALPASIRINEATAPKFNIGREWVEANLLDISTLGIGLLCKTFIPKGALIDIKMQISAETLIITGEVRSAISGGKGLTRLGVKFTGATERDTGLIRDFIQAHERRSEPRLDLS
jgi:hypothetical protein